MADQQQGLLRCVPSQPRRVAVLWQRNGCAYFPRIQIKNVQHGYTHLIGQRIAAGFPQYQLGYGSRPRDQRSFAGIQRKPPQGRGLVGIAPAGVVYDVKISLRHQRLARCGQLRICKVKLCQRSQCDFIARQGQNEKRSSGIQTIERRTVAGQQGKSRIFRQG